MQRNRVIASKLVAIKERLEEVRVDWAIFAGAAAFCYGSDREITDIDILVKCEDLDRAKAALKDIGTKGFDIGCGAEIETPEGTCPFFLDEEMIRRIDWRQFFGVVVPAMSVEDNIVLKAILQRGEERGKQDIKDIQSMIAHEKVDLEYLKNRATRCHAERRVIRLLKSLIPDLT